MADLDSDATHQQLGSEWSNPARSPEPSSQGEAEAMLGEADVVGILEDAINEPVVLVGGILDILAYSEIYDINEPDTYIADQGWQGPLGHSLQR